MTKTKIIDQNSERSILQERLFLSKMNNPFLVNMLCSFQDKDYLYLVLQLFTGGDLRYHLTNYIYAFTETQLKFLFSNIILALQYIHSKGILHRDLKPENILFDNEGYAYVTDFGIAWSIDEDNEGDNSGTPAYMSPEALYGLKQDYCVDFYSLGIIGYEIIKGKTPYEGNSRHEIKKQMSQKTEYITEADNFSEICIDFINGLINKSPSKRLGAGSGISELKDNIFFKGMNWDLIYQHKYLSPLYDIIKFSMIRAGEVEELFDVEYCAKKESIDDSTLERYEKIKNGKYYSKYFKKYSIICVDNILRILPKTQKVQIINRMPLNQQNNMNYNNINNNEQLNNVQMKYYNRSQSTGNLAYPNVYDISYRKQSLRNEYKKDYDVRHMHRKYKYASRSQIKHDNEKVHLKLPFIKNNNIKNKEKEKKIKYYYENKLFKYKAVLKKLQSYYLDKLKEKEKEKNEIRNKEKYRIHLHNNNIEKQPIINPNFPYQYNNCGLNCCNNCNAFHNNNNNINNQLLNQINFKTYFDQIYKNRDNFFFKYNDDYDYNDDYNYEYSDSQMNQLEPNKYYDSPNIYGQNFHHPNQFFHRNLYEQNLKEKNRIKDKEVYRNKLRYITEKSTLPPKYVEYEETVTDDEEEEEEEEGESIQRIRRPRKYIRPFKSRSNKAKTKYIIKSKKSSKKSKEREKESKKEESESKDETTTVKVKKGKAKSSKKSSNKTNKKSKKTIKSNKKDDNKKKKQKNKDKTKEEIEEEGDEEQEDDDGNEDEEKDGDGNEEEEGEGEDENEDNEDNEEGEGDNEEGEDGEGENDEEEEGDNEE